VAAAAGGAGLWLSGRRRGPDPVRERAVTGDRSVWRMPPLATLSRPVWSRPQRIGMVGLRCYLVVAVLVLAVKIGELASAH